jgi:hypothetical protein
MTMRTASVGITAPPVRTRAAQPAAVCAATLDRTLVVTLARTLAMALAVAVAATSAVTLAAAASAAPALSADYEGPRTFQADEVLAPAQIRGPHFEVAPEVPTEGYLHVFQLETDFGPLEVEGRTMLVLREHETQALARLDDVSKAGVFVKAAGSSLLGTGKGVVAAVKDPEATAKGIGGGLKRFGTNLGRMARRTGDKAVDAVKGDDKRSDEKRSGDKKSGDEDARAEKSTGQKAAAAGEGIANSVFGVNSAVRRWAKKVGVDPYTTNPLLKKALFEIGRVDAGGRLATKVVVPIPTLVSGTATVGGLVWGLDPEALMKLNEQRLRELGASNEVIRRLYLSKGFTLSLQTRLAAALHAVKARGCGDYVSAAEESDTERDATFFVESAEMLRALHAKTRVAAVLPDSRAMVAKVRDGRAIVLLPVDWVRWTEAFERSATEVEGRARSELGARKLELRTTGRLSPSAKAELARRGWTVVEGLPWSTEVAQDGTPAASAAKSTPARPAAKSAPAVKE